MKNEQNIDGFRLLDMKLLAEHVSKITSHVVLCEQAHNIVTKGAKKGPVIILSEHNKSGQMGHFEDPLNGF